MKNEILDVLNVPKEAALSIPNIVIKGNEEIIIENHKGIRLLREDCIECNTALGLIQVQGENLEIKYMSKLTIALVGAFKGIKYVKDEK